MNERQLFVIDRIELNTAGWRKIDHALGCYIPISDICKIYGFRPEQLSEACIHDYNETIVTRQNRLRANSKLNLKSKAYQMALQNNNERMLFYLLERDNDINPQEIASTINHQMLFDLINNRKSIEDKTNEPTEADPLFDNNRADEIEFFAGDECEDKNIESVDPLS